VEEVCNDTGALDGLTGLVASSLLRMTVAGSGGPRVGLLETIREYGGEQLDVHAEAGPARKRHAAWYLTLAEEASAALAGPDAVTGLALLDTLLNLGDLARARTLLEESLVVARRYDDRWNLAMSLTMLGHLRLTEGDPVRARAELAEAATLFAATGNLVYLPWCLEALAGAAAAGHELSWAAELAGARDALRAQTGALLPAVHRAAYEQMLDVVRSGLGEADFAAAHGKLAHLAPPDIIEVIMEGEARHE
jgi:hypothetical protein